jgi:glucose/arabinose dehydrogenase
MGPSTQWADPTFIDDGTHTDAWCQNPANVVPPALSMQAHSAPLDLIFYPGGAFPASYNGDLFVTFHGSWNRSQATGYKVVHVPFGDDGMPSGPPALLLESAGEDNDWAHRPVGLAVLPNGVLLVTSDASTRVIAVGYAP